MCWIKIYTEELRRRYQGHKSVRPLLLHSMRRFGVTPTLNSLVSTFTSTSALCIIGESHRSG